MTHRPVGWSGRGRRRRTAPDDREGRGRTPVPRSSLEALPMYAAGRRTTPRRTTVFGGRAAAHLDGHAERPVQRHGPLGVDQRHRALDELVLDEELVPGVGDHVDQRVPMPTTSYSGAGGEASGPGTSEHARAASRSLACARCAIAPEGAWSALRSMPVIEDNPTGSPGPSSPPATTSSSRPTSPPPRSRAPSASRSTSSRRRPTSCSTRWSSRSDRSSWSWPTARRSRST